MNFFDKNENLIDLRRALKNVDENKFRNVFYKLEEIGILLDSNLKINNINLSGEKFLNITRDEIKNNNIISVFNRYKAIFPFTQFDLSVLCDSREFTAVFHFNNHLSIDVNWIIIDIRRLHIDLSCFFLISETNVNKITERTCMPKHVQLANSVLEKVDSLVTEGADDKILSVLNSIVHALPGCAHVKSAKNLSYMVTNHLTLELLGMQSPNELIGKDDYDLAERMEWRWPAKLAQQLRDYDSSVISSRKSIIALEEEPYLNAQGKVVMNSLTKIPLVNGQDEPLGILTFAIDMSCLKNPLNLREIYKKLYVDGKKSHEKFMEHVGLKKYPSQGNSRKEFLSERELDCFLIFCLGKTAKQAAQLLKMSPRTFEKYLEIIKIKLNCHDKSDLFNVFLSLFKS